MDERTAIKTFIGKLKPFDAAAAVSVEAALATGAMVSVEFVITVVGVESIPSLDIC